MNNIVVISGSHKIEGASDKVAVAVKNALNDHYKNCMASILSIKDIPFWDEGKWGAENLKEKWNNWSETSDVLKSADGFVIISPEYAGMVAPRLTNFLLLCSGEEVGHKPALAITVSASRGGAYPMSQLRAYCTKNNHMCLLPDHVIVRDAQNLNFDTFGSDDEYTSKSLRYCLSLLDQYSTALKSVRKSGVIDHENYPYGM